MLVGARKEYFTTPRMYNDKRFTPIMKLESGVAATAGKDWVIADRIVVKINGLQKAGDDNYYKFFVSDKNREYEFQMYKDDDTHIGDTIVIPAAAITYRNKLDYYQSCLGYTSVNEELTDIEIIANKTVDLESITQRKIKFDYDERFLLIENED